MDFFIQQLVNGITLGSLYALLAIGYSIVYGVLGLLNFAQGEVYMVGAFIGFGVLSGSGRSERPRRPGAVLALVLMFAAAALGLACSRSHRAGRVPATARRLADRSADHRARHLRSSCRTRCSSCSGPDIRNYESSSYIPFTIGIHVGPLNISLIRIIVIVTTVASWSP